MRSVLDVSQQMLNSDFLGFRCTDRARDVHKVAFDVAILIDLLLSEEATCGQANLLVLLYITNYKTRVLVVPAHNVVKLDVVQFNLRP